MQTLIAALGLGNRGTAVALPSTCLSHSPDPDSRLCSNPVAVKLSRSDSEQILADFVRDFVGPAHGIDKAELETAEGDVLQIVAFVYDWNGVIAMPSLYHGLVVALTQSVPEAAVWQL
jgi:hypothetical protein